jgi:hypothetical protein
VRQCKGESRAGGTDDLEELVGLMVDGDVRLLEDELAGRLVRVDLDR